MKKVISIRLSEEEIEKIAKKTKSNQSNFIRFAISRALGEEFPAPSDEQFRILKDLKGNLLRIGQNINTYAEYAGASCKDRNLPIPDFESLKKEIKANREVANKIGKLIQQMSIKR